MGIIKRQSKTAKNGYTYEVNFTYFDSRSGITKRHFKRGFLTKKEAELYEIEKKEKIRREGSFTKQVEITLNDAFNEFITTGSSYYQANTMYNCKKDWHYFKDSIGLMKIRNISYSDVQNFFNSRINEGIETNKSIRKTLNRVFVHSIRAEYIKTNPLQHVVVKGKVNARKKEILSKDDLNKLLYKLAEQNDFKYQAYIVAILIGYYTGLRLSEVLALSKRNILFSENLIQVNEKLVYKGLKTGEYYVTKQMKSKKSSGTIPLPLILRNYLIRWFEVNPYEKVVCDANGYYLNPACLSNYVKKMAKTCGITFNFHMLRHSFATMLIENHTDIRIAQELMRHENFNTTLSIYMHIKDEQKIQAVNNVFKIDCDDFVADNKK